MDNNSKDELDELAYQTAKFDSLPSDTAPVSAGMCPTCQISPCNAANHYFGVCPTCHRTDGYINVGTTHVFLCHQHKKAWAIGANLFSSAMYEAPEKQRAEQEGIGFADYDEVEPHYDTTGADEDCEGCRCFRCEDSDVQEIQFGDPKHMYGPEDASKVCRSMPCNADKNYFGVPTVSSNKWIR